MASIAVEPNGRRRILFVAQDGKRKTIRLGMATAKQAESFRLLVEGLVAAGYTGHLSDELSRKAAELGDKIHSRLAAAGLVKPRENGGGVTLGAWLDEYFAGMVAKPNTFIVYGQVRRNLQDYFGADRSIKSIAAADGDQFRQWLVEQGLSENTIARRIKATRTFFSKAVKRKVIPDNPFSDVRTGALVNPAREYFVTRDMADRVIEACPDSEWRLIVALARYGGVRTPSETLALRWGDVLWDQNRIRVPSPKTEHHPGGDCRIIPLFPEIRPHLQRVFDEAMPGSEFVITRYRNAGCNLRTQFLRIIQRAGLTAWPRPFHNLRASRQTELAEQYPIQVVCQWIGNSVDVARKHYLQVTDAHFDRAVAPLDEGDKKAAQIPAQYRAELGSSKVSEQLVDKSVAHCNAADYVNLPNPTKTLIGATGNRTPIC